MRTATDHAEVLSGRASLSAVATIRPDADAQTPRHALRTAATCTNCA